MKKFDKSSGISKKEIDIIKYKVKDEILKRLPVLPDPIETKLFFQGRYAWVFSWGLLNDKCPIKSDDILILRLLQNLKRNFIATIRLPITIFYAKYRDKKIYIILKSQLLIKKHNSYGLN